MLVGGGDDGVLRRGQVVQPLLHQQPDDAIRMKDEVTPIRVLITDFTEIVTCKPAKGALEMGNQHSREQGDELWCLCQDGDIVLLGLLGYSGSWLLLLWAVVWSYGLCGSRGWLAVLIALCRHRQ